MVLHCSLEVLYHMLTLSVALSIFSTSYSSFSDGSFILSYLFFLRIELFDKRPKSHDICQLAPSSNNPDLIILSNLIFYLILKLNPTAIRVFSVIFFLILHKSNCFYRVKSLLFHRF